MNQALPREMQQHTYAIMDRVEEKHLWFVGRRKILESFLRQIVDRLGSDAEVKRTTPSADKNHRLPPRSSRKEGSIEHPAEAGTQNLIRILDVGCGTGANL